MKKLLFYLLVMIALTSCETAVKQTTPQVKPNKSNIVRTVSDESSQVSATLELVFKSLDKKRKDVSPLAIGIKIIIQNNTAHAIYIPDIRPSILGIKLIRMNKKKEQNYEQHWLMDNIAVSRSIQESLRDTIFDINEDNYWVAFNDSLSKALVTQSPFDQIKEDYQSMIPMRIKYLTQSLLFLNKDEKYEMTTTLNGLLFKEGQYKLSFKYPIAISQEAQKHINMSNNNFYKITSAILPETIKGFHKWTGQFKSDIITINIH